MNIWKLLAAESLCLGMGCAIVNDVAQEETAVNTIPPTITGQRFRLRADFDITGYDPHI